MNYTQNTQPYLNEQCEFMFVSRWASSVCWVLPVQVESVKVIGPQEIDCGLSKLFPAGIRGHHGREGGRPHVPAANSKQQFH